MANFGRSRPDIGRLWLSIGQDWPVPGQMCRDSVKVSPKSVERGPEFRELSAGFGQTSVEVDPEPVISGRFQANSISAGFGPESVETRLGSA